MFSKAKIVFLASMLAGCGHESSRSLERIAAVPLENLSGDSALDWVAAASTPLLVMRTAGAQARIVLGVSAEREAAALRATQIVRGYYSGTGENIRLHASLFDTETSRVVREIDVQGSPAVVLDHLAGTLKDGPVTSTHSAALEAFGNSVTAKDPTARRALLEQSLRVDPGFAPAAIALAQLQPPHEATATLRSAIGKHPEGWERARLELALASVDRDPAAILKAMETCLRFSPNDTDMARGLGDALINRHRYAEGVQWLEKAAALEPQQAGIWNLLSYANTYAGNLAKAKESLERYRKSSPDDPNAYDTTGEVHWSFGQFAEAEANFMEAQRRDPQFLGGLEFSKAALARFLAGDTKGADQIFARYLESRRALRDPLVDLRAAHWLYLTDRKPQATQAMRTLSAQAAETAALAHSFLALWQLQEGDPAAPETARQAIAKAKTPASMTQAGLVLLLTQPRASAAEWQSRLNRSMGPATPPALKRLVLAYALILAGHYKEARTVLEAMYTETPAANADEIRVLLAKAKIETGDKTGAKALLVRYPLPPQPGENAYATLWFPQFLQWRKEVGL